MSNITSATRSPRAGRADAGGSAIPLLVIATAQLMLVLDDSIANIALPTIQGELDISPASLSWVINAYILAFGGLLLLGGRMGDLAGRRRVLQGGIVVFTIASLLAGFADSGPWLIATRALQGVGAAMTAPNALALISTTFAEGEKRNRAMAVYGAMSGLGLVAGLLLGGALTALLGWRSVFFINVPIGILVLVGSRTLVEAERHQGKLNLAAALSSVAGMTALIYGITRAAEQGWTDEGSFLAFGIAIVLLSLFVLIQARSSNPLLPLRLFEDRRRAGSYGAALLLAFGPMGTLYLMTLYMQDVLAYGPMQTGLAWLPFGVGIIAGAALTTKMLPRFSPGRLAVFGALIAGASMFWLSLIGPGTSYAIHIMPALFGVAFGFVMGILSLTLTAVHAVRAEDSGIASALLNASQQIGVALGLAVLSTIAVSTTSARLPNALDRLQQARAAGSEPIIAAAGDALIHGYAAALAYGALALALAAAIAALFIRNVASQNGGDDRRTAG